MNLQMVRPLPFGTVTGQMVRPLAQFGTCLWHLCCTAAVAALNILDLCLGAALYDYVICLIIRNLFTLETLTWGGQES